MWIATPTATLPPARAAQPIFSPGGGEWAITQPRPVIISTTTAGANIYYTLNGTTPSQTNGVRIASNHGTISVTPTTAGTTLRAIALASGMSDSDLNEGIYYYLGGNGADLDPSAAAPPGDLDRPPVEGGSQSTSVVPQYDHNGNLIRYKDWSYIYDAQNRLTSASKGAHTALFHYDGKNRQIMRSIDGAVRFSVWDDWELIEEYDTSNVKQAAYLLLPGQAREHEPRRDSSGHLLESYRYDLYGTPSYFNSTSQPINSSTVGVTGSDSQEGEVLRSAQASDATNSADRVGA